jgi:hypothetical protein
MRNEYYSRLRDLLEGSASGVPKSLSAQFTGKRQLLEALLLDAVRTFHLLVHARKPSERQRFQEVEEWITAEDTEYPFSFVNVCEWLGINANAVRTHLLRWKASQRTASVRRVQEVKRSLRIVQR